MEQANSSTQSSGSASYISSYNKRIIFALRKIMQAIDLHSRKLVKEYDITVPQILCLYELFEHGTMTLAVLAQRIHLSPSTVVGIIDRLEEKQFVTRARSSHDRRTVFIDITERGKEFVTTTPHLLHNRLQHSINELTESEQIFLANALDTMAHLLE